MIRIVFLAVFAFSLTFAFIACNVDKNSNNDFDVTVRDFDVEVQDYDVEVKDFDVFNSEVDLKFDANAVINSVSSDLVEMTLFLSDIETKKSQILDKDNFHGYFQLVKPGDTINLMAIEKKVIHNSELQKDNRISLVLDYSGSMSHNDNNSNQSNDSPPIFFLVKAVEEFIRIKSPDDLLSIIRFSGGYDPMIDFSSNKDALIDAIYVDSPLSGGTALYSAINFSLMGFNSDMNKYNNAVIAFSDGSDNASSISLDDLVQNCQRKKIPIFTIGLKSVDFYSYPLSFIALSTGGFYYESPSPSDLIELYEAVSSNIKNSYHLTFYWDKNKFPQNINDYQINFITKVVSSKITIAQYMFPNISLTQ